jgi:hypothetical protein
MPWKTFKMVGNVKEWILKIGSGTGSGTFCRSSGIRIQIRIQNSREMGFGSGYGSTKIVSDPQHCLWVNRQSWVGPLFKDLPVVFKELGRHNPDLVLTHQRVENWPPWAGLPELCWLGWKISALSREIQLLPEQTNKHLKKKWQNKLNWFH